MPFAQRLLNWPFLLRRIIGIPASIPSEIKAIESVVNRATPQSDEAKANKSVVVTENLHQGSFKYRSLQVFYDQNLSKNYYT